MSTDRLLDYLGSTLAEAYRREQEQEENVWRSLPFFAATLALQLTVLVQLRGWVGGANGPLRWLAVALLGLAGTATLVALLFLALSILPAKFEYVARDPDLLEQARRMWMSAAMIPGATEADASEQALSDLKSDMVRELAYATANNHRVNRRRAERRTKAGLAMLASVCITLALVGVAVVSGG